MRTLKFPVVGTILSLFASSLFGDQQPKPFVKSDTISGGGNGAAPGGEWSIHAIQTPGAPALKLEQRGKNLLMVFWQPSSTNFSLLMNTNTVNVNWQLPAEPTQGGSTKQYVVITPQAKTTYFRLEARP